MENKEWIKVLDEYLSTAKMSAEDYEQLDDDQRMVIQTLKRAFKRITYKNENN